ncbi:hypothetical protein [Amycolatopsis samaneae]|uniref:Uncharacterized protein n=1 Tax=Amycolatopsis samaneae TaxID=664691 RepID=A0ABW5GR96_9PSEU
MSETATPPGRLRDRAYHALTLVPAVLLLPAAFASARAEALWRMPHPGAAITSRSA